MYSKQLHGIAYAVTQRTHEIGVRMALGATPREVVRMVVRQAMALVVAAILCGVAAAIGLTRLMASLLSDVTPTDPATFATVAARLAATALFACFGPALRAARIDPAVALAPLMGRTPTSARRPPGRRSSVFLNYQTRQAFALTIGCPAWHENAL